MGRESLGLSSCSAGTSMGKLGSFCMSAFLLLAGKSQMPGPLERVCHQHAGWGQDLRPV